MNNKQLVVAKINFRNIKLAYIITAITVGCIIIQDIVFMVLAALDVYQNSPDNMTVSLGNYLFLVMILGAVFIPSRNFRKMMNLGSKRADFFKGCALNYAIMALVISLLSMVLYFTYDKYVTSLFYRGGTLDILYWFGWIENGPVIAFFQQYAWLQIAACLLLAAAIYALNRSIFARKAI